LNNSIKNEAISIILATRILKKCRTRRAHICRPHL